MKIFNDMDMQLEEFQPIEPGKVKMYACGPTVYNYIHVGNARPIVIFDVLRRILCAVSIISTAREMSMSSS